MGVENKTSTIYIEYNDPQGKAMALDAQYYTFTSNMTQKSDVIMHW